jgi:hypothetical protein
LLRTLKEQAGPSSLAQAEAAYGKLFDIIGAFLKEAGCLNSKPQNIQSKT